VDLVDSSALIAAKAKRRDVVRWLQPLVPVILLIVVWTAFVTDPRPGLAGSSLAVSITLGLLVLAGAVAVPTMETKSNAHIGSVLLVLAASIALIWFQPNGAGVAGLFVGLSLLVPILRQRFAAIIATGVVISAAAMGIVQGVPAVTAVLTAVTMGAFYGVLILAVRLGEAFSLSQRLVAALEHGREVEAEVARAAERQRLAREMHDVLAHSLSGLLLQLEGARLLAVSDPADPRLPEAIAKAHHLGRSGLAEARKAIETLRDDDLPGPERLAGLAARFEKDRGVPCHLEVTGTTDAVGSETRLAIYRVAQEALTNITKHACPDRVDLHLAYEQSGIRLTVEDSGADPPPDPPADAQSGGYGLTGMRERAELLGGTLTAAPTARGFRVELAVPR
jgi:signal transduction histidine kinase